MGDGSKARIEAEAGTLIARDGYHGMGLKALSEATGLPYGSIYHHFPGGKEEIAATAILANASTVADLLAANFVDGVTAAAVDRMFGFMARRLERSGWELGCVVGTPAADDPSTSPRVGAACAEGFALIVDPVTEAFVRDGRDPDEAADLALTLVAAYEGATLLARARRSREPLDRAAATMTRLLSLA